MFILNAKEEISNLVKVTPTIGEYLIINKKFCVISSDAEFYYFRDSTRLQESLSKLPVGLKIKHYFFLKQENRRKEE